MIKKELQILGMAFMFYSRIPVGMDMTNADELLNRATRYFPFVGYIVGLQSFLSYYAAHLVLPNELAAIIALLIGIFTTGAFHEDGLADFFDGFGGGWTQEKILDIMKDSRVGTYGMVATIAQLALKFFALNTLTQLLNGHLIILLLIFIAYHALARTTAIQVSFILPYVREDEKSKAKPIAKAFHTNDAIIATLFGLIPFALLCYYSPLLAIVVLPLVIIIRYFQSYLKKWIGGYTGDCLGAIEQIAEVIILISLVALWKFI